MDEYRRCGESRPKERVSRKRLLFAAAFAALVAAFVAVHSCRSANAPIRFPRFGRPAAAPDPAKIRRQLDAACSSYRRDCLELRREFLASLRPALAPEYARARDGVEPVVRTLSGFGVCARMCCKAVKDRFSDTSGFVEAFQAAIREPILVPCARANRIAADRLQSLALRLEERRLQYAVEVVESCRGASLEAKLPNADLESLGSSLEKSLKTTQDLQISTAMAALGAVMEGVFVRSTVAVLRSVLGKAIAKIAASGAAGAACAAADGPLPIGDAVGAVVAVGGLAWTVWDIRDACKVLPGKLRAELNAGIDAAERELGKQTEAEAERLVAAYLEAGSGIDAAVGNKMRRNAP